MTYVQAQDEVFTIAKAGIDSCATLAGYQIDTRWPADNSGIKPDPLRFWIRVSSQVVTDEQKTLANFNGIKNYEAIALMYAQIFCPRIAGAKDTGLQIAQVIRQGFRNRPIDDTVWFRRQKIVELPETEKEYPINLSVEFHYYETV